MITFTSKIKYLCHIGISFSMDTEYRNGRMIDHLCCKRPQPKVSGSRFLFSHDCNEVRFCFRCIFKYSIRNILSLNKDTTITNIILL